eukprot:m.1016177 g.1016177  ORF g.1016177 m.1016177 type:complete len:724 (+) comp24078_c0_seq9:411-2582(+)
MMDVSYLLVDGNTGRDIGNGDCLHLDSPDAKVWHLRNAVKRACARLVLCDAYEMTVSCDGKVLHHHTALDPLIHKVFRVHVPIVNAVAPPVVPVVAVHSSLGTGVVTENPIIAREATVSNDVKSSTSEDSIVQKTSSKRKRAKNSEDDIQSTSTAAVTKSDKGKKRKVSRSEKSSSKDHNVSDNNRYHCTVRGCGKDFARESSLHSHLKKRHRNAQATKDLKQKEQDLVESIKNGQLHEPHKPGAHQSGTARPPKESSTVKHVPSKSHGTPSTNPTPTSPARVASGESDRKNLRHHGRHEARPSAPTAVDVKTKRLHYPTVHDRKSHASSAALSVAPAFPPVRGAASFPHPPLGVTTIHDTAHPRRTSAPIPTHAAQAPSVAHRTSSEHGMQRRAPFVRSTDMGGATINNAQWRLPANTSGGRFEGGAHAPASRVDAGRALSSGGRGDGGSHTTSIQGGIRREPTHTPGCRGGRGYTSGGRGDGGSHSTGIREGIRREPTYTPGSQSPPLRRAGARAASNGVTRGVRTTVGKVAGNTIAGGIKVTGKFLYVLNRKQKFPRPKVQDCKTGGHDPKVQLAAAKYYGQMQPFSNIVPLTRQQMLAKGPGLPTTAAEIIALYIAQCSVGENMGRGRLLIITEQTFNLVNEIQQCGWEQGLYKSQNIGDDFFVHRINGVEHTLRMVDQVSLRVLRAASSDASQGDSNEVFRGFCDHFKTWLEAMRNDP